MAFPKNYICVVLVDVPYVNSCTKRQPKIFLPITYDEVNVRDEYPKRPLLYLRIKSLPPVFHSVLKSSSNMENYNSFWILLNTSPKLLSWLISYNRSSEPCHRPIKSVAHYLLSKCLTAEEIKLQLYL